jgi:hypothetical protein
MKRLPCSFLCLLACLLAVDSARADSTREILAQAQNEYRQGDLTAAKKDFKIALQLDPRNQTAINFLRQIAVTEKAGGASPGPEKQSAGVVIPKIEIKEASLASVLDVLKADVAKATNNKVAVNFVLQVPPDIQQKALTLSLSNIPLSEALRYIGSLAGVQFSFEKYAIVVKPVGSGAAATTGGPAPQ